MQRDYIMLPRSGRKWNWRLSYMSMIPRQRVLKGIEYMYEDEVISNPRIVTHVEPR